MNRSSWRSGAPGDGMSAPRTLFNKLWDAHVVAERDDAALLYIDRHLVHEVTSPQAFEGLRLAGRSPWRPGSVLATADHAVPTLAPRQVIADALAREQVDLLQRNCRDFGITLFPLGDVRQGIVHVVGPEQGATLPGMTVVAGDSHTSTHGAFAALAFGIGTSDVEHVLATQCLWVGRLKTLRVEVNGALPPGVFAKDLALHVVTTLGAAGGTGYAIEFTGSTVRSLSMEARMTLCNMAIEAGARVALVGVDTVTLDYLAGRPYAPNGAQWHQACDHWAGWRSDDGAVFDRTLPIDAMQLSPLVSWGTSPAQTVAVDARVPDPQAEPDALRRDQMQRALDYMALTPGMPMTDIAVDRVFIGSCTNARIEDLREAAAWVRGRRVAPSIKRAMVVPGSGLVKAQAEAEGLDEVFLAAGFEWREPGCSMCLGMNDDHLAPGERCASTSNRNFEGRQGAGGRTHLVSPAMAAAAAVHGHFVDIRRGAEVMA